MKSSRIQHARASFPIVGIGASAGGLAAFGELLSAIPPDSGMGFVVIQHLDPTHPSMLGEALGMLSPPQRQTFWQALNSKLSNKQQLAGVCRQVQSIGKPVYAPVYLMSADGGRGETGAVEQPKLWNQALSGYLHCATDIVSIR